MTHHATTERTATLPRPAGVLGVRSGEQRLVGWMAGLFAIVQASHGLGANAADTLFFLRFGVEFLPVMILASGPVVMAATLAYTAGLTRIGPRRWLMVAMVVLAGWLVLEWLGILADVPGIYPAIWLGGQVAILVSFTMMWNAAGEACTARQAKRLYPLFASAGIVGGIVGNALTGPLAAGLGTQNLLLVQAGLLAVAAAVTIRVVPFFQESEPASGGVMADLGAGLAVTRSSPMLRLVAWAAAASMVLFFLVTFPFSEEVTRSFGSETEVAAYLGFFSSAATAATFVVSLLAANRLFARLGVVATLLLAPLVYVFGFGMWLVSFGLVTATVVRGLQWVAVNGLWGTAWSSLFNVLPGRRKGQVMAFVAAVPTQVGTMASGTVLIIGSALPRPARFGIGLAVALATVALVVRMRSAYGDALVDAVRRGLTGVFSVTSPGVAQKPTLDADAVHALSAALDDPRPGARATAVTMLARTPGEESTALLETALDDPEPAVRMAALDGLAGRDETGDHLALMLADPAPRVRRRAIELVAGRADGPALAVDVLDDTDPGVRAAAAALAGTRRAGDVVGEMLDSHDPRVVRAGLDALARNPSLARIDPVVFADHPDRRVRTAAARCLAGRPDAAPTMQRLLDDPSIRVRETAAEGLADHPDTVGALLDVLAHGSVRACDAALRALTAAGRAGPELHAWATAEVRRAAWLRRHRITLEDRRPSMARDYLVRLLSSREERLERWALLAMTSPSLEGAMPVVRDGIWSDDAETKAQALEALESIADRSVTRDLIALLEEEYPSEASDARSCLRELTGDLDHWIRALAVRCLTEELIQDLDHLHHLAESDGSELVRSAVPSWEPPTVDESQTLDAMDRVLALQRVPMFSEIDPEDLERIADVTTQRRYDSGEAIFRYGEPGDEMMVIIEGDVEVRRPEGELIRTYGPGQHVGELALLRGGRSRAADVVAGDEGVRVLVLSADELQDILEERPEVAMAMLATLAERLGTM